MIILESIILAAGYCSRFDFKDNSYKKYMLPFERSNILNYIIVAMDKAGIKKINIVVDNSVDISKISDSFYEFANNISTETPNLNYVQNFRPERENGYSLFLGAKGIQSESFILSMADHIFSDNIYSRLIKSYRNEDIVLATDPMKIDGVYDLEDCTKVHGDNLIIKMIGKNLSNYNRLDMGVFIMKTSTIKNISQKLEKDKEKFGVSDIVLSAIDLHLNVGYFDFPNTIWLDIDTDIEYQKLNNIFYKSSKFRPFNLDLLKKS